MRTSSRLIPYFVATTHLQSASFLHYHFFFFLTSNICSTVDCQYIQHSLIFIVLLLLFCLGISLYISRVIGVCPFLCFLIGFLITSFFFLITPTPPNSCLFQVLRSNKKALIYQPIYDQMCHKNCNHSNNSAPPPQNLPSSTTQFQVQKPLYLSILHQTSSTIGL